MISPSTPIATQPSIRVFAREGVDHHISGAGIEGDHLLRRRACWDYGDVRDAADIESHASASRVTEEQVVDEWHQGRALTTGCNIARAKIGYNGDAGAFGEHCGLTQLQRV